MSSNAFYDGNVAAILRDDCVSVKLVVSGEGEARERVRALPDSGVRDERAPRLLAPFRPDSYEFEEDGGMEGLAIFIELFNLYEAQDEPKPPGKEHRAAHLSYA